MKTIAITVCVLSAFMFASCSANKQPVVTDTMTSASAESPLSLKGNVLHLMPQGKFSRTIDDQPTGQKTPDDMLLYFPSGNLEVLLAYASAGPNCGKMSYTKTGKTTATVHRQEIDSSMDVALTFDTPTSGTASYHGGGGTEEYSAFNVPFSIARICGAVPEDKVTYNGRNND